MQSLQEEWERKATFLKECALFKELNGREIKAMTASSTICEYPKDKVIQKTGSRDEGHVAISLHGV